MNESDQLTTSFITLFDAYCYVAIPFGLNNAGVTYQRCMQQCLGSLIDNLQETFSRLRAYNIKLNTNRCPITNLKSA